MFPSDNDFEAKFTFESEANPLDEKPPFHILFLGDWSGNGPKKHLNARRPIVIDRDNFDEVLSNLKVNLQLDLTGDGNALSIDFTELEDFHPDNLFHRVPLFKVLRECRQRLLNADTFNEAADQVRAWFNISHPSGVKTEDEEISPESPPAISENLLDQILSQPKENSSSTRQKVDNSDLGRFISKIVSPHLIKTDDNEQSKLVAALDESISELMRTILHHPQFQALESAWRGLYFLVKRVETDVDLKIFIFDVSHSELASNLKTVNSLADSFLYQRLTFETDVMLGGEPFAVVCTNFSFGVNVDDIATLIRLAKLAKFSDAPVVSHIRPEMFGLKSFSRNADFSTWKFSEETMEGKLWTTLRTGAESTYLGLSPMRFLGRIPYGKKTDPTEKFSFEEFSEDFDHEKYLWINPSFAFAMLLAQSYRLFGWDEMGSSLVRDFEDVPMHIYQQNGETKTKACAEVLLNEGLIEMFLTQGLMPLISFRNTDSVRLARFQSVSIPLRNLNGKWNQ